MMLHETQSTPEDRVCFDWGKAEISFSEHLQRAIDYIEFKSKNGNAREACETIERRISEGQKYKLYQKYFPIEWNASRASYVKKGFYKHYSERACEFFALVDEHLFPLFLGWNEDPETDFEHFGIYSLNIDFCCAEIEYEYINLSYVVGLLFFSDDGEIWEYLEQHHKIKKRDFPRINRSSQENFWNLEKKGRTELYINLLEVIDHSTGNPWLDLSNCCQYGETFEWSERTVEFLSSSYKQTQAILKQMNLLDILIETDPKKILLDLITLWNEGQFPN